VIHYHGTQIELGASMDLFEWTRAVRRTDPDTSVRAAIKAEKFAGEHHQMIISALWASGVPMASEQIADRIGLDHAAVWRRMSELERGGVIEKSGDEHLNRSNRWAKKYRISRTH